MISSEILKALNYLLISSFVLFAYQQAGHVVEKVGYKKALMVCFLWCGGIALFASIILGKPTCNQTTDDYVYSTCEEYENDGYNPTTEERIARFAYIFTLFYVPAVFGIYNKKVLNS